MQPLLLLHGAIGAADQLEPLAALLSEHYRVYTLDFSGHGKSPAIAEDFSITRFAEDVLEFMDREGIEKISIFGYSMGGYVGLYLAKHHPERIESVVTLATKFHWDAATAENESKMLDAAKLEAKVPAFAQALENRHEGKDWKEVLSKTALMLQNMGADNPLKPEDYPGIQVPALILLGDRDKMVTLEETVAVYKALPGASMGILPGTPHPIEQVNRDALAFFIHKFLG